MIHIQVQKKKKENWMEKNDIPLCYFQGNRFFFSIFF